MRGPQWKEPTDRLKVQAGIQGYSGPATLNIRHYYYYYYYYYYYCHVIILRTLLFAFIPATEQNPEIQMSEMGFAKSAVRL